MKKGIRSIVSIALASSMLFTMTGCDKANKECQAIGDEFMQALIEREYDDMADLCADEDEAAAAFIHYSDNEAVQLFLDKATFEVKEADCSTKDGKGTITYIVTLPDYDAAVDEEPEDVDDLEDIVDDLDSTTEITVKVKFKLNKKDKWQITNPEDIADAFYGELYSVDFGFSNYDELIESAYWYASDDGVYSAYQTVDYDVYFTEYLDMDLTFEYYYEDDLVKTDTRWCGSYGYFYLYDTDMEDAGYNISNGDMPTGTYTVIVRDANNTVVTTASCQVVD